MITLEEWVNTELFTGKRLFYTTHDSLCYLQNTLADKLPAGFSFFTWTPYKLQCEKYIHQGREKTAWAVDFNNEHDETMTFLELLYLIKKSITDHWAQSFQRGNLPQDCCILCVNVAEDELKAPEVKTLLQEITSYTAYANYGVQLLLSSDEPTGNETLIKYGHEVEIPPLTEEEIRAQIKGREKTERKARQSNLFLHNPTVVDALVEAVRGMTPEVIDSILDWGLRKHPTATDPQLFVQYADTLHSRIIRQSEMLSFLPPTSQIDPKYLGGFSNFLEYMKESSVGFSPKARELKIEPPKGVVLVGLPGTGKSMAAKVLSHVMGMRTIVLDMSASFGSLVGESESRIRKALRQVENFGRCILLVDEADKAFAGAKGAIGDSGTTRRVVGTFLTWLQEKKSETYVVLTMNDISVLPPEFLRAGRFDNMFYTTLPVSQERLEIIRNQFAMRGLPDFELLESQWDKLLRATDMFSGAELATIVRESQRAAFSARESNRPTFEEIYAKATSRIPQAKSDKTLQDMSEEWKRRATPVSKYHK